MRAFCALEMAGAREMATAKLNSNAGRANIFAVMISASSTKTILGVLSTASSVQIGFPNLTSHLTTNLYVSASGCNASARCLIVWTFREKGKFSEPKIARCLPRLEEQGGGFAGECLQSKIFAILKDRENCLGFRVATGTSKSGSSGKTNS